MMATRSQTLKTPTKLTPIESPARSLKTSSSGPGSAHKSPRPLRSPVTNLNQPAKPATLNQHLGSFIGTLHLFMGVCIRLHFISALLAALVPIRICEIRFLSSANLPSDSNFSFPYLFFAADFFLTPLHGPTRQPPLLFCALCRVYRFPIKVSAACPQPSRPSSPSLSLPSACSSSSLTSNQETLHCTLSSLLSSPNRPAHPSPRRNTRTPPPYLASTRNHTIFTGELAAHYTDPYILYNEDYRSPAAIIHFSNLSHLSTSCS